MSQNLIELINVVEAIKSIERIPQPQRPRITYFSENDLWLFQASTHEPPDVCITCRTAETIEQFRGNHLRLNFPNLVILDDNTIGGPEPDGGGLVHPHCRCFLIRIIG